MRQSVNNNVTKDSPIGSSTDIWYGSLLRTARPMLLFVLFSMDYL